MEAEGSNPSNPSISIDDSLDKMVEESVKLCLQVYGPVNTRKFLQHVTQDLLGGGKSNQGDKGKKGNKGNHGKGSRPRSGLSVGKGSSSS